MASSVDGCPKDRHQHSAIPGSEDGCSAGSAPDAEDRFNSTAARADVDGSRLVGVGTPTVPAAGHRARSAVSSGCCGPIAEAGAPPAAAVVGAASSAVASACGGGACGHAPTLAGGRDVRDVRAEAGSARVEPLQERISALLSERGVGGMQEAAQSGVGGPAVGLGRARTAICKAFRRFHLEEDDIDLQLVDAGRGGTTLQVCARAARTSLRRELLRHCGESSFKPDLIAGLGRLCGSKQVAVYTVGR